MKRWMIAAIIGLFALMAFGITMSIRQSTEEASDCHRAGGRIVDLGKDWICIDEDGRVIVP